MFFKSNVVLVILRGFYKMLGVKNVFCAAAQIVNKQKLVTCLSVNVALFLIPRNIGLVIPAITLRVVIEIFKILIF